VGRNGGRRAGSRFEAKGLINGQWAAIGTGRTGRSIWDFARRNEARVMWSAGAGEEKAFFTRRNVVEMEELRFEAKVLINGR
jgi:hypothetical protein